MIVFRNHNHLGDVLLQLGLFKMLHKLWKLEVGFIVMDELQYETVRTAKFLSYAGIAKQYIPLQVIDFIADDAARERGLSLIEMWAKSIPKEYSLQGEKKPFIQLTKEDYKEAHKLKLKDKVFVAPFKVTCPYTEVIAGQNFLHDKFAHKGYYLLGSREDNALPGFIPLLGLPIRVVGVLLQEAKALYCVNNGLANLAWAVGLKNIHEYLTPATEWAKVPYSRRLN